MHVLGAATAAAGKCCVVLRHLREAQGGIVTPPPVAMHLLVLVDQRVDSAHGFRKIGGRSSSTAMNRVCAYRGGTATAGNDSATEHVDVGAHDEHVGAGHVHADGVEPVADMLAVGAFVPASVPAVDVKLVQVDEEQVERARAEKHRVGQVVLGLPGKVPDAAFEAAVPLVEVGQRARPVDAGRPHVNVDALRARALVFRSGRAGAERVEEGGFAGLGEADEDDAEGVVGAVRAGCKGGEEEAAGGGGLGGGVVI